MSVAAKFGFTLMALIFLAIPEPFLDPVALGILYFVWVKDK